MGFKTTTMNFLEDIPEYKKLKEEIMKSYDIKHEDDIDHPLWDVMMSDYVSQVYCLHQI